MPSFRHIRGMSNKAATWMAPRSGDRSSETQYGPEVEHVLRPGDSKHAVYGCGCIVRVGTDTQIADLLVEKGAHPLETCAPCHFCDPWPKLLKDQHEWGTILS